MVAWERCVETISKSAWLLKGLSRESAKICQNGQNWHLSELLDIRSHRMFVMTTMTNHSHLNHQKLYFTGVYMPNRFSQVVMVIRQSVKKTANCIHLKVPTKPVFSVSIWQTQAKMTVWQIFCQENALKPWFIRLYDATGSNETILSGSPNPP